MDLYWPTFDLKSCQQSLWSWLEMPPFLLPSPAFSAGNLVLEAHKLQISRSFQASCSFFFALNKEWQGQRFLTLPKNCIDENWKTLHPYQRHSSSGITFLFHFFEEAFMTIIQKDHHIRSSKRFNYNEEKSRNLFFLKNFRLQIFWRWVHIYCSLKYLYV